MPISTLKAQGLGQWQALAVNVELTYGTNVIVLGGAAIEGLANLALLDVSIYLSDKKTNQ